MFNKIYNWWARCKGIAHKDTAIVLRNARRLAEQALGSDVKVRIEIVGFSWCHWHCWRPKYQIKVFLQDEHTGKEARGCDQYACSQPKCEWHEYHHIHLTGYVGLNEILRDGE